jgi:hypothetical protein
MAAWLALAPPAAPRRAPSEGLGWLGPALVLRLDEAPASADASPSLLAVLVGRFADDTDSSLGRFHGEMPRSSILRTIQRFRAHCEPSWGLRKLACSYSELVFRSLALSISSWRGRRHRLFPEAFPWGNTQAFHLAHHHTFGGYLFLVLLSIVALILDCWSGFLYRSEEGEF